MSLVVQKFGGTSVGDTDRIRSVADHIASTLKHGNSVVAVVSAMGKTTNSLIRQAEDVSNTRPGREMDMLLTSGERISMALLGMALADRGVPAMSFTGSQAGIVTDTTHGKAKILDIRPDRITSALEKGLVPVVAGFQGVSTDRNVTTLGRGGSDTTAVAIAYALKADACEIYTDVTGVFSADPRIAPKAKRIPTVFYDEMLEMAGTGGRVLALRSVEFARRYQVPLHVRSSFTWEPGTWVVEEDPEMEKAVVSAITHDIAEAKITVAAVPDKPGVAGTMFRILAQLRINVDMIVQNVSVADKTDISFTVPIDEADRTLLAIEKVQRDLELGDISCDRDIARVSIIGSGMKTHEGVAATMFETLASNSVNIDMISTSTIRVSCVIRSADVETAVQSLHTAFSLDA